MSRNRSWCFTFNNYFDIENFKKLLIENSEYYVFGYEIGENKTPHLQGYCYFKNARTLNGLKKIFPKEIHWEIRKGNHDQARNYCIKDNNFEEFGIPPKQGSRTDINGLKEKLNSTNKIRDIIDDVKNVQQIKFAESYLKYKEKERNWKPEVIWYYGKTGTGKSHAAFTENPGAYKTGKNLKWWEGYDAHEIVIIDEFRSDFCTYHELLQLLDKYPYRIENKGGSRQFLAKKIVITSCYAPHEVYNTIEDKKQLFRRIDKIYECIKAGEAPILKTHMSDTEVERVILDLSTL